MEGANPEMDGLKKLVAGRLRTEVVEQHPDADVLTAFAENALPDAERAQLLQHLGACKDCREILYLGTTTSSEAQKVLSFQPKRRWASVYRWGTVAASVVIMAAAVIAIYPVGRARQELQKPATAAVENYSKLAEKKIPADVGDMRDRVEPVPQIVVPNSPPVAKERPERKHMTAKPQAGMEFDDTDQVRIAGSAKADEVKKSNEELPIVGRNVMSLPAPSQAKAAPPQPSQRQVAGKDKSETGADLAYSGQLAQKQSLQSSSGGLIDGTVVDPSGAVISNAKVTMNGPVGSRAATSDAQGQFVFGSLAPGSYSIKTEATGFKSSEITNVAVLENKRAAVGVKLEPGSTAETVEVSGEALSLTENARADTPPAPAASGVAGGQVTGSMLQKAAASNAPTRMKTVIVAQWRLSPQGVVQKSLDFGRTWQKVLISGDAAFRSLCSVEQHVWVGGSAGTLFHSVDSGQSWQQVQPSAANEKLNSDITHIDFSNPSNGFVSDSNGEVWSTSDGGETWRRK